jgi:DNA-directed RNA polymerase specialized sigma24 family protein
LIEGIKENNETIFTQFYEQYHARLYFYFLRKTQSESVSADLVQTTFIKCWRYRESLRFDLALSHQLFCIAKTCLIGLLRQKAKERLVSLDVCPSVTQRPDMPADLPLLQQFVDSYKSDGKEMI